jgi:hypothetical protein
MGIPNGPIMFLQISQFTKCFLNIGLILMLLKCPSDFKDYILIKSFHRHTVFDGHKNIVCFIVTVGSR